MLQLLLEDFIVDQAGMQSVRLNCGPSQNERQQEATDAVGRECCSCLQTPSCSAGGMQSFDSSCFGPSQNQAQKESSGRRVGRKNAAACRLVQCQPEDAVNSTQLPVPAKAKTAKQPIRRVDARMLQPTTNFIVV
jgi:hypothetical protein